MSDHSPDYASCCLCGGNATDWRTVRIGEHEAHQSCAEQTDVYDIVTCAHCHQLELADDAAGWARHPDGRLCPVCAAEVEPGESPLAPAVRALDRLVAEMREGVTA